MLLEVKHVSKAFGQTRAVQDISLTIGGGEIVGLVGPNGSGKTTFLNLLIGNLEPTAGAISKGPGIKTGMAISRKGFFNDMTVDNNLTMYSQLMGASPESLGELKHHFQIDYGHMRFGGLSAGMKQRVALLLPFLRSNQLVLLDEPTNHLDVDSILALRAMILKQNALGVSFLVTSHIFSDLEKMCSRIIFLKKGELIRDISAQALLQQFGDFETAYTTLFKSN